MKLKKVVDAIKEIQKSSDSSEEPHLRRAKGRKEFELIQSGKQVSPKAAILAKCYECGGHYEDGAKDCEISDCPLYIYMPYQTSRERKKRVVSEEQRAAAGKRFKKLHKEGKLKRGKT
jgi:hypothetical protein